MNPLHFAVVVGINEYPAMTHLMAAHNDAEAFYKWVIDPNGGGVLVTSSGASGEDTEKKGENAELILASLPKNPTVEQAQPTREAIHAAVERFIARVHKVRPNDWEHTRLYFYGAGHGIAAAPRDAALLAANASRKHLGRHVSCASLLDYFNTVQYFHEVVFFVDCCRPSFVGTIAQMPVEWTLEPIGNGPVRRFLGCGAIFNRQAFEEIGRPPDECRGYFTRALIDGLRGAKEAVDPAIYRVTKHRLKIHIQEHMRRATTGKFRIPLEPDFYDEGGGDIVFGPALPPPTYRVQLEVSNVAIDGLIILANNAELMTIDRVRMDPNRAVFECFLPVGAYEAIPVRAPRPQPGKEWLFKVVEGDNHRAFF